MEKEEVKTRTLETFSTPATSAASSSSFESEIDEQIGMKEEEIGEMESQKEVSEKGEKNEEADVVAEQNVIGERIMYTIKQLLEMEMEIEKCVMPESVKGTAIAADKTTKALSASLLEVSDKGLRCNDLSRSLSRHNSSSNFNDGRGRRERGSSRGGRGGRGGRGHHDTAPPLEDCAPLDINEETRWKPTHAKSRLDGPVEFTDASLKEAKSVLNKLSIEKFDKLSDQLIEVAVRGLDVLKGVIEMVIAKAQTEWHFSTMYAELCAKIAQTDMPAITLEDNKTVTDTHKLFRTLLLLRCQKEFEARPEVDGALKDLREDERREKELIMKRASLGHIRFVGELFKQRMLSSRIMHECVSILFGDITAPDEESLECLCNLLSTIGQALEGNASEKIELNHINGYYVTIKKLSGESKLLCTRVRFMLQDLLELRSNGWVARRKETKAMTIAEVHAEVAREAKEKERTNSKTGGHSRLQRSYSMNSTGSISSNDRRRGSGTGAGASAAWKARAASSSVSSTQHKHHCGRGRLGDCNRRRMDAGSAVAATAPRPHPRALHVDVRTLAFRLRHLRPNRTTADLSKSAKVPEAEATPALTAEAFEKKVKAIFDEYVELEDMEEAYASFTELNASNHYALIPTKVLNIGLDKGDKEREAIAGFLAGLYDRKVVTGAALENALQEMLESAEDIEIDIPKTLSYLSVMVAPSVVAGSITVPQLVSMSEHLCYNGKAAKLIGSTLAAMVSCEDETKVQALLASESVDFMALLAEVNRNEEAVQAFYKDYSLEFLI
ncbi:unnamed protein product [Peronospora destructor]|uniref:MI domain-containing protein n=1 Tax=Peronospora destructor TaxID=86335 RepID=A0AAV0VJ09_9STRA|nr:unnamed protein product [Peronospora destructor]